MGWWERPPKKPSELQLIRESLGRLEVILRVSLVRSTNMATVLEDLAAQVAATKTVQESAVQALVGLHAALDAAVASGDMGQVAAVAADLKQSTDALAAAVVANTPAAPETPI